MEITTHARYVNRVLVPAEPLNLPEGAEVRISIWFPEEVPAEISLVEKDGTLVVRTQTPIDVEQLLDALRSERWTACWGQIEK
ncbi:MAG: DUF104 domain-containing protein [Fimbriimonadales bacterium]|nr:DUF104 domain-containing protein [Fimbriimonadales bacterium]